MTIHLDHTIVPARHKVASAKRLAELLGVPWAESGPGPFAPVYVNDGLTLDFIDTDEAFPVYHFCFRVSARDFDAILGRIRAADIPFRSEVHGPPGNRGHGGRLRLWQLVVDDPFATAVGALGPLLRPAVDRPAARDRLPEELLVGETGHRPRDSHARRFERLTEHITRLNLHAPRMPREAARHHPLCRVMPDRFDAVSAHAERLVIALLRPAARRRS